MKNILVIGAHYDDAELGAAGTMAKFANEGGGTVYKLTLTDNVTDFTQMNIHVEYESSAMQSHKSCEIMGVSEITELKPVNCNHLKYSTQIMQSIEKIIFQNKIDTAIIHYDDDMNTDHIEASKICLTAARHCDNILMYQSNGYILNKAFQPNFFVDISGYIDIKRKALEQYGDEHNRFDRLFELSIERCNTWGYANKCDYAEGFKIVKMLNR